MRSRNVAVQLSKNAWRKPLVKSSNSEECAKTAAWAAETRAHGLCIALPVRLSYQILRGFPVIRGRLAENARRIGRLEPNEVVRRNIDPCGNDILTSNRPKSARRAVPGRSRRV